MVKLRFFAALKDIIGESEMSLEIARRTSVRKIFGQLTSRFPDLKKYERVLLVAVNEEYGSFDTDVSPGDEVAFFPPVSGG